MSVDCHWVAIASYTKRKNHMDSGGIHSGGDGFLDFVRTAVATRSKAEAEAKAFLNYSPINCAYY